MLAPIVIFCYKRLDTLKLCIDSLLKCKETIETDVIIFSDAASRENDQSLVVEVRNFIKSIEGFKSLKVIERDQNFGVDNNIIEGLKEISNLYDNFIVVEDDIVVHPYFIKFMNQALEFYKTNNLILSISGFNYVKNIPRNYAFDVYFAKRTNSWGWASWSNRLIHVEWDLKKINTSFSKLENVIKFNHWGSDRSMMLRRTIRNKIKAWDIRLDYFQFLNNQYTVYPVVSLCNNIGFDFVGATNTFGYNRYQIKLEVNLKDSWLFSDNVIIEPKIKQEFVQKNSIPQRLKTKLINFCRKFF